MTRGKFRQLPIAAISVLLGSALACVPPRSGSFRTFETKKEPLSPPAIGSQKETPEIKSMDESKVSSWRYPRGNFKVNDATWNWQRVDAIKTMGPIDAGCQQIANSFRPSTNALLHVIAFAEGTEHRYDVMFTHARVTNNCSGHPRLLQYSGGLSSDAAGRYQFLSTTWDGAADFLRLRDFRAPSQDRAAVYLIENVRGLTDHNRPQKFSGFSRWMAKLTNEWASIPGNNYNQGQKGITIRVLWEAYSSALQNSASEP